MKIEKLNHSKFKVLLYTLILGVILIFIIIFQTSKAAYRTTQSINVANGSVSYSPSDLNVVAVYLQSGNDYVSSNDTVPTSGYVLNTTKTSCTKNGSTANVTITYDSGTVSFTGLSKGVKCNLYFDIDSGKSVSDIVASATVGTYSITGTATTNEGLKYVTEDGTMYSGATYYYRGAVNNNWVKFAGMYWRIIRFNGDGSIRMIYSGTTAPTAEEQYIMTGEGTQIGTSIFNPSHNDNMYVGWKYTSGNVHGTGTDSTMRTYLVGSDGVSGWYSSSGLSLYASYLADGKFCNDRYPSTDLNSSNNLGGAGTTTTYYGSRVRLYGTKTASFGCQTSSDIFTEKVGLITGDEVMMAGGFNANNSSYYLYSNQRYWTMSPSSYVDDWVYMHSVDTGGFLGNWAVTSNQWGDFPCGVRPVVNLKTGTKLTGDGTYDNVYEIAS